MLSYISSPAITWCLICLNSYNTLILSDWSVTWLSGYLFWYDTRRGYRKLKCDILPLKFLVCTIHESLGFSQSSTLCSTLSRRCFGISAIPEGIEDSNSAGYYNSE
jgi:hypothetical protein